MLRPFTEDDGQEFIRVAEESREAWAPWTPAPDPTLDPDERFRRELNRGQLAARAGTHLRLGAFDGNGQLVGLFALNEIVRGVLEGAYASWQVTAKRMGQGFGTEGVLVLLSIAFGDGEDALGLHRVQANVMPANSASLRVAEKVGFRREGVAERYLRIAGAWEDHVMFALTQEEWRHRP